MPNLVVIAGPNGAGKSTSAPLILRDRLRVTEFVNVDDIARGLSGYAPESVAIEAGRIALSRLRELAARGADIAFEATLASRGLARWVRGIKRDHGYRFHLVYLWLPDAEAAVNRVAGRARRGGHSVPADVIRRRYARSITNFVDLYSPIADSWAIYDNSCSARMIASRDPGRAPLIDDLATWRLVMKQVNAREARAPEGPYDAGETGIMGVPFSEITLALQAAVRNAWREHKALGYPIVIWRDGKVVEVPPEEIEV